MNAVVCLLLAAVTGDLQPEVDEVYLKSQTRKTVRLWTSYRTLEYDRSTTNPVRRGEPVLKGELVPIERVCTLNLSRYEEASAGVDWLRMAMKARHHYVGGLPEPNSPWIRQNLELQEQLFEHCARTDKWPPKLIEWVIDEELYSLKSRRETAELLGDDALAAQCEESFNDLVKLLRCRRLVRFREEVESARRYLASFRPPPEFPAPNFDTSTLAGRIAQREFRSHRNANSDTWKKPDRRFGYHVTGLDWATQRVRVLEELLRLREQRFRDGLPLTGELEEGYITYAGLPPDKHPTIAEARDKHFRNIASGANRVKQSAKRVDDKAFREIEGWTKSMVRYKDTQAERVWDRHSFIKLLGEEWLLSGRVPR